MRFPKAIWRGPIPNQSPGKMGEIRGLVLHIEQGSEAGTNNWFHNPGAQASAHFGNPKTGPLDQWVDTADMAWAEVDGNPNWISVEHEGNSGDLLTPSQIENDAQLLAWLHQNYKVALELADTPSERGLIYHAAGGTAWGSHPQCPGLPIIAQRPKILARAEQILAPPKPPAPKPTPEADVTIHDVTVTTNASGEGTQTVGIAFAKLASWSVIGGAGPHNVVAECSPSTTGTSIVTVKGAGASQKVTVRLGELP